MSAAAEKERRHREDLAEASRLSESFGLGQVKEAARVTVRLGTAQIVTGVTLVIAAISTALSIGLAHIPGTPKLIVLAASACAALAGWQLLRLGSRPRTENRVFWYAAGLIKLVHDEPEPRVLRWEHLDSAEIRFDSISDERHTGLDVCTLRGSTGTEITIGATRIARQLAAEADRLLSSRLVPQLTRAYDTGEPVILGHVRIDQAGVELSSSRNAPLQVAWADVAGIVIEYDARSGSGVPASSVRIDRANRRSSIGLSVSGIRNGILIPHLIEHVAAQHRIPVRRTGPGAEMLLSTSARPPLAAPEDT